MIKERICEDILVMIKDYLENDLKTDNLDPLYKMELERVVNFLKEGDSTLFLGKINQNTKQNDILSQMEDYFSKNGKNKEFKW